MMRKILLLLVAIIFSLFLAACGDVEDTSSGDSATNEESTSEENEDGQTEETTSDGSESEDAEESSETYSVGDTAEVGDIEFTLNSVSTTDERNEMAETDPAMVVKIEYEITNNTEEEIPVGGDLQVYDGTGNQVELYPLDNTMGSLQPGKSIQGTDHYGIEEGPVEIYFEPMMSFDDPAIFEAEVE